MRPNARIFKPGEKILEEGEPHGFVYWLRTGWVARTRRLPDERNQIIAIFLPGDFFGVKTIFLVQQPDALEALSAVTVEFLDCREVLNASRDRIPMSASGFGGRSVRTSAGCIIG